MSPWVVTLEALEPFRVPAETQNPEVLPYLKEEKRQNFDVQLEVFLKPKNTVTLPSTRDDEAESIKEGDIREKTGVGINLSRQRLVLHNGRDTPDDLIITTIKNDKEDVKGTLVLLTIKTIRI